MILFGITIAIYSPEIGLKQIHLRSAVLLELFSVGIDISWLVIFVDVKIIKININYSFLSELE